MKEKEKRRPYLMGRFHNIRTAILTSYFVIVIMSLAVFGLVAIRYTEKTVLQNAEEYSVQLIERVNSDIDSYMDYLRNISALISSNGDVHDYLFREDLTEQEKEQCFQRITTQFGTIMETRDDIVNIGIIGKNGRYIINKGFFRINENIDLENVDWIQSAFANHGNTTVSSSHVQNVVAERYEWVITLSKALRDKNSKQQEGVFFVDLNYSSISELCDAISFGNKGYIYILDAKGKFIYHPQQQLLYSGLKQEKVGEVLECKESSFITEDGKLYSVSRSKETGWTVVGVSYMEEFLKNNEETTRLYLVSAILILMAALVIAFFLSDEITKPIKKLGDSMKEVEKGNFDNAALEIHGQNEIARLSSSFNIMTTEIKHLMEQNVEEQRQKRKSELRALQAQINPHFLYNTLDSIIWMAEWGKTKEVVLMTSSLAKLLRQSISNQNELVRVEEEVEYTKSYLTIQKMRYKDKLEYEILINEKVQKCRMPKLVLQPLVENAIYHGIKYKEGKGVIRVEGDQKDGELVLKVSDDGIGMSKEALDKIFEKRETDTRRNGVGVLNVHERIQLYYGKEYGLRFYSVPDRGTAVEVHLPWTKEGEERTDGKED